MKTDLMAQTTDDACASTDTTSEYSLISAESDDIENMEKLREKIKNQDIIIRDFETKLTDAENNVLHQNEKISLYEATIRDKNDLIKSLNNSIELMKETKELSIKQLKDQIADLRNAKEQLKDLQNASDLSKNLTSNKDDANAAESAEFEKKPTENADFQTLQKQFAEGQSQNETLKDTNCQLKSKLDENIKQITILEQKSDTEARKLRAKIAKLEKNAKIYEARSKEEDVNIAKYGFNSKSTDAPFVLLNQSKVPNTNFIKIGDQDRIGIVENGWTVIMRRFDGSVDFRGYADNGVGDLSGELWFGFESIHKLTSSTRHELYIQLVDFDDVTAYARYDNFVVGSGQEKYALKSLGAYSGNAGDALRSHENGKTEYWDPYHGYQRMAWWFSKNKQCCLTGKYTTSKETNEYGMYWGNWYMEKRYSLKACKMLIRPH